MRGRHRPIHYYRDFFKGREGRNRSTRGRAIRCGDFQLCRNRFEDTPVDYRYVERQSVLRHRIVTYVWTEDQGLVPPGPSDGHTILSCNQINLEQILVQRQGRYAHLLSATNPSDDAMTGIVIHPGRGVGRISGVKHYMGAAVRSRGDRLEFRICLVSELDRLSCHWPTSRVRDIYPSP